MIPLTLRGRARKLAAPDPLGAMLMKIAGISWGAYSFIGRSTANTMKTTLCNFAYSVPLTIAASLVFLGNFDVSMPGVVLAMSSGALASGLGYAVWYAALQGLTVFRAATVQLSVPVIGSGGDAFSFENAFHFALVSQRY